MGPQKPLGTEWNEMYVMDLPQAAPALPRWSKYLCCVSRNDALTLCAVIRQRKQNAPPLLCSLSHLLYCLILNHSPYACLFSLLSPHLFPTSVSFYHCRLPSTFSFFQFPCSCHTIDSFIFLCHLPLPGGPQVTLGKFILRALKMHFHTFHENRKYPAENRSHKKPKSWQFFSKDQGKHVKNMPDQRPGLSNPTKTSG